MLLSTLTTLLALAISTSGCGLGHSHLNARGTAVPVWAPVPETSHGLTLNAAGYAIEAYGNGAYMVTEGLYQAFFLVSNKGVILVDCPPTIGHKLLWAIGNTTSIPITHLIYSHFHADHIGAVNLIPGAKTIGHIETANHLRFIQDPTRPPPRETFANNYTLKLGNQTLELSYAQEAHVSGNIFIYAPLQKVLMLVDVAFPGWTPIYLGFPTNVPEYLHAVDEILKFDFKTYIGGHFGRAGNRTDIILQQEYLADLKHNCEVAINASATNDPVHGIAALTGPVQAANPGNNEAVFEAFFEGVANYCKDLTNEKWLGVLGGADTVGYGNAFNMMTSLRIDYGVLGPFATV